MRTLFLRVIVPCPRAGRSISHVRVYTLFLRVIVPCPRAGSSISHVRVCTHLNTFVRGRLLHMFFSTFMVSVFMCFHSCVEALWLSGIPPLLRAHVLVGNADLLEYLFPIDGQNV